ncbi:MAG: M28 family peptidase [Acidobacteriota bacterium]
MTRSASLLIAAVLLTACNNPAQSQMADVSGERIRAHVKFLASDLLEGRAPGSRGGDLATEYIASQFALIGAKPAGDNGTYFQKFTLVGVAPQPNSQLTATPAKGPAIQFKWLDDFVGVTEKQTPEALFDAPAIFVGHGIVAPEYQWDDYKGIDVKGKVVVLFTGEPPSTDPKFFTGPALTYYGRWTYKFEEAARHGAAAALIIHTEPTASYGWEVVRSSWGSEEQQVRLAEGEPALTFMGWMTKAMGERVGATIGMTADQMVAAADQRGFTARELPLRFTGHMNSKIRTVETRNVIARIEGSDPVKKDEAVAFSAHWDHLGVGEAVNGDSIYNGAADNATGSAMLLEMAHAWAALPQKPKRSALFIAVGAEEQGLRGSYFFGQNPVIPANKIAAALNFDMFLPYGRAKDVTVNGAERTTIYPIVQNAAQRMQLTISPDARPSAGLYYRSDHFSFARVGIPSFSVDGGEDLVGKPEGTGKKMVAEFTAKRYHQPSDEYKDDWDFAGMEQYAQFGLLIGIDVANLDAMPSWRDGDEFLPARQKSGVK